jgi:hypothetical protein
MKGFLITLDSSVAFLFVLVALIIIASQSINPHLPGNIYLKQLSMDIIKVLEKTGGFEDALLGNSSKVTQVLEATPSSSCFEIQLINSTGTNLQSYTKSNCENKTDADIEITTTVTYMQNKYYIIREESWQRREQ